MIIDFHTHIFPEKIAPKTIAFLSAKSGVRNNTSGTADALVQSMTEGGVDRSVILPVATKPSQFDSINRYAVFINEHYSDKLLSFGGIHPYSGDCAQELEQIKSMGLKGIKLHPDYQDFFFNDIRCKRLIYRACELGLVITVHAGRDIGYNDPVHCTPQMVREVVDEVCPEKLVLAHMGGWDMWQDVEKLLCGRNIWLDTAFCLEYMSEESFLSLVDKHGYRRILFATDSPWSPQKAYVEKITGLLPDESIRKAVLGGNAEKLLNED